MTSMQHQGPRRLVVTDVDSTFITDEVIELIADHAGVRGLVAQVTERAMRGEIDFAQSLRQRVATLEGLPVSVLDEVRDQLVFSPGAQELVAECQARGWPFGLISGGFEEVMGPVARSLGIRYLRANRLETRADAAGQKVLTGKVLGQIVDGQVKAQTLQEWAVAEGIPLEHCIAVGDGANDLAMLALAGIGVAFRAKPVVQAQAPYAIDGSLCEVLDLLACHRQ